jgi:hypothetical protein
MGFIKFNNSYIRVDIIIAIVPKIFTIVNASIGLQTEYAIRLITTDENVNVNLEERYLSKEERDERMDSLAYFMNRAEKIREKK